MCFSSALRDDQVILRANLSRSRLSYAWSNQNTGKGILSMKTASLHNGIRTAGNHVVAALFALTIASPALSQDYPNRPVRLLTPYGAGGSYDGLARVMADKLSWQLGQQVIVDNRPGAAG